MRTVKEVSKITGVSVRTLHHYDSIGLLKPAGITEAGYRLYDDAALERLQQILLFRELEFPLRDIKEILESPDFDHGKALDQQIKLLELKRDHLNNLIDLACGIKIIGVKHMDFTAFDTSKIDEYAAQAKASYGKTAEYQEFEKKSQGRTKEETQILNVQMMSLFKDFCEMRRQPPDSPEVQAQVKRLQEFITENFYTCSNDILYELGRGYAGGGELNANIDKKCGEGTGEFVFQAIKLYCGKSAG